MNFVISSSSYFFTASVYPAMYCHFGANCLSLKQIDSFEVLSGGLIFD